MHSHLQEAFGRKNMNCVLYVSEKSLCRLDPRIFLTKDGTAEIFRRGNLDHYVQCYSPSPSVSRIYGQIMPSTIAITTASSTQSLNTCFLEELKEPFIVNKHKYPHFTIGETETESKDFRSSQDPSL